MAYNKSEYLKQLDKSLAQVGVPQAQERLEQDDYGDGQAVDDLLDENETETIGGFEFISES